LGFSSSAAFVCDRHVDDDVLEAIIHEEASATHCDFCDRREDEQFAADTHPILTQIAHALNQKWTNPVNVLFYDSESESGYARPVSDFEDVLRTEGEWPDESPTWAAAAQSWPWRIWRRIAARFFPARGPPSAYGCGTGSSRTSRVGRASP
jgi:hypothetical protein